MHKDDTLAETLGILAALFMLIAMVMWALIRRLWVGVALGLVLSFFLYG